MRQVIIEAFNRHKEADHDQQFDHQPGRRAVPAADPVQQRAADHDDGKGDVLDDGTAIEAVHDPIPQRNHSFVIRVAPPRAKRWQKVMYVSERSEEHTTELQSIMSTSYAVFCL